MFKIKNIIKMSFIFICLSFTMINGYAAQDETLKANNSFMIFIDEVFGGNELYKVVKSTGEDYTKSFIISLKGEYEKQNYNYIQEYFIKNDLTIENDINSRSRNITNSMHKAYHTFKTFIDYRGDSFTKFIDYSVSATATCDNKGNILSYSNAYVSITPSSFTWQMRDVSCYINNKGNYINVITKFTPVWDFVYEGAGISQYVAGSVSLSIDWSPMY